jgi:hypothetical protein
VALVPQLLAVFDGTGQVSGGDGKLEPISAGEAVFWAQGEGHEFIATTAVTAMIVEGPSIAVATSREGDRP